VLIGFSIDRSVVVTLITRVGRNSKSILRRLRQVRRESFWRTD
jgi:hypothetical protein